MASLLDALTEINEHLLGNIEAERVVSCYCQPLQQIQCNRTQRDDGRAMKMNKLDEGVGDTFGLVRG